MEVFSSQYLRYILLLGGLFFSAQGLTQEEAKPLHGQTVVLEGRLSSLSSAPALILNPGQQKEETIPLLGLLVDDFLRYSQTLVRLQGRVLRRNPHFFVQVQKLEPLGKPQN